MVHAWSIAGMVLDCPQKWTPQRKNGHISCKVARLDTMFVPIRSSRLRHFSFPWWTFVDFFSSQLGRKILEQAHKCGLRCDRSSCIEYWSYIPMDLVLIHYCHFSRNSQIRSICCMQIMPRNSVCCMQLSHLSYEMNVIQFRIFSFHPKLSK